MNEQPVIGGQDATFDDLLRVARGKDPETLRRLALWGRTRGALDLLERASRDGSAPVAGAGIDGLLLLDEEHARAWIGRLAEQRTEAIRAGRYADAIRIAGPLREVRYDLAVARESDLTREEARRAALLEISALRGRPPEERAAGAAGLARRAAGLGLDAEIDALREP